MRVLFIVGQFPVLSETFILNQITGLLARGHEVEIYGFKPNDRSKTHADVETYQLLERVHYIPEVPKNHLWRLLKGLGLTVLNIHKDPLVLLRSLNVLKYGKRAASLTLLYRVMPLLGTQPYDIIHCQFGMYGLEGSVLHELGAIQGKLVTSFRGYDISWFVQQQGAQVYDSLFKVGDFFLANCEFFRQRAIQLGCDADNIVVHGSGIDCSRFQFKARSIQPGDRIRIAITGRLVEKKGTEYVIRAMPHVIQAHPNVELNIIGDGVLKEQLQQLIEELNVSAHVTLLGWKNQREVIEILNTTHIFVAPSITANNGDQDAPVNTLKEAMAMGLPVIGTIHGGIPELIQDGISGYLVPERDGRAIAEKLIALIEHSERWAAMGAAGRSYVETHYDTNQLNDELVEIYQQILKTNVEGDRNQSPTSIVNLKYI